MEGEYVEHGIPKLEARGAEIEEGNSRIGRSSDHGGRFSAPGDARIGSAAGPTLRRGRTVRPSS